MRTADKSISLVLLVDSPPRRALDSEVLFFRWQSGRRLSSCTFARDVVLSNISRPAYRWIYFFPDARRVHAGFPFPVSQVGEMIKDREGVLHNGMTGKGLKVVHCYLDFLWQMGPQTLPNEGFRPDGVGSPESCVVLTC